MRKSIGLFGKKHLDIEEREIAVGDPGYDEVIVKVGACGICGTDLNFVKQWTESHMPLGHELAGEVVEAGKGVTSLEAGDHVIIEDCSMCGICVDCKNGRPDLCRNMIGLEGQSGMGQYLRVKQNSLIRYEGLSFTEACLTEPLSVCVNSVIQSEVPFQGSVAVLGTGPLGLMTALVAKHYGAGFVAITGVNSKTPLGRARMAFAREMGIDLVVDASEAGWEESIREKAPRGVDRVIVSAPPESINDGLKIVGYAGVITFFGLHFGGANRISVDINDLIFRKITLRSFFQEPAVNFNVSIGLLKKGLIPGKRIVSHAFGVKDVHRAFTSILERSEPIIKAVILPNA